MRYCFWCHKEVADGAWCDCHDGQEAGRKAEAWMSRPPDKIEPETMEGVHRIKAFVGDEPYTLMGFKGSRCEILLCVPVPCRHSYWWVLRFMIRGAWRGWMYFARRTQ